jgi:hypothetical protein
MIEALATRDRRALFAGVAVIGGLVFALRGAPAWWRWRGEVRAAAAEAIERDQAVKEVVAGFSQSLDTLGVRIGALREIGPAFLSGATSTEAASMLASVVGEMARSSLVRIDAIELRADSAPATKLAMPHVRAEVQATADIAGLAALLQTLERGPLLLSVRRLSVRAAAVDAPPNQVESLTIQLTVEGLALLR